MVRFLAPSPTSIDTSWNTIAVLAPPPDITNDTSAPLVVKLGSWPGGAMSNAAHQHQVQQPTMNSMIDSSDQKQCQPVIFPAFFGATTTGSFLAQQLLWITPFRASRYKTAKTTLTTSITMSGVICRCLKLPSAHLSTSIKSEQSTQKPHLRGCAYNEPGAHFRGLLKPIGHQ